MPVKYQPDYIYLRHVRIMRVHIFTLIQFVCFVAMWVIKSIKQTSIAFPVLVITVAVDIRSGVTVSLGPPVRFGRGPYLYIFIKSLMLIN